MKLLDLHGYDVGVSPNLPDLPGLNPFDAVVYSSAHHGGLHIWRPSTKVHGPPSLSHFHIRIICGPCILDMDNTVPLESYKKNKCNIWNHI